ncbi:MAG: MarR family transcriptional regulator [Tepidisphaeraceae bacterium]|jgi:MarR family transcriptional regulator for hemolysin
MQLLSFANKPSPATAEASSDRCARHVLSVVPPVVRAIRNMMRHHRLAGLSVPQFRAMALLSRSPRASLSSVAEYVGTSLPAASRMIDGLVGKKLVARQECCDDRRQISLALTARGAAAFHASHQATQRQMGQRLKVLSSTQRRAVIDAMRLLAGIFGADGLADRAGPQIAKNGWQGRAARS